MMNDYDTGYGKPPKKHQFKKGKSGNPKGRPKKSKGKLTLIEEELQSEISVKEGKNTVLMTKQKAIIKQLVNKAVQGDHKAMTAVLDLLTTVEERAELKRKIIGQLNQDDNKILDTFLSRNKKNREINE